MCTVFGVCLHFCLLANAPAQLMLIGSRQFSKEDDITKHSWLGNLPELSVLQTEKNKVSIWVSVEYSFGCRVSGDRNM
jgi:hypothetical protein